jgi:hypothetical protein
MIWIIAIYLISVIMFLNILIEECQREDIPGLGMKQMFDYYGIDLIWIIVPLINTIIVLLWYGVMIADKIKKLISNW